MAYKTNNTAVTVGTIFGVIFVVALSALMAGQGAFVDASAATHSLETQGYSSVRIVDRHNYFASWNGCGEGDVVAFECTAKNPAGKDARVTVCCGWWLKDCTVRAK